MDKLQQAKEALLQEIINWTENPDVTARAYDILCQTELNAKALDAQIEGGVFKAHCHHEEFPPTEQFYED